jgi:hypothetical protein
MKNQAFYTKKGTLRKDIKNKLTTLESANRKLAQIRKLDLTSNSRYKHIISEINKLQGINPYSDNALKTFSTSKSQSLELLNKQAELASSLLKTTVSNPSRKKSRKKYNKEYLSVAKIKKEKEAFLIDIDNYTMQKSLSPEEDNYLRAKDTYERYNKGKNFEDLDATKKQELIEKADRIRRAQETLMERKGFSKEQLNEAFYEILNSDSFKNLTAVMEKPDSNALVYLLKTEMNNKKFTDKGAMDLIENIKAKAREMGSKEWTAEDLAEALSVDDDLSHNGTYQFINKFLEDNEL